MAERDYLKTAKELEKERRTLLRNVMATIPDSLLILDRTLLIKTANRSFYKLFQVKPKEVIGRGITDVLGDEDGKLSAKLAALLGTKDRVENYELPYQSAKLGERIFNITARGIIVAEEEEEEEELVVIRDITERKRAEEMLRRTEENFRRSLDDSPLGIRIVNSDGETTYANRAMLDIYGYASIEELKAIPVKERYTPESYAQHQMRKGERQRSEHVPSNYEISIVRKGGEIRHLEVFRKEVLWNGHTQFQVIYQDITERKAAEEALRSSELRYRSLFTNMLEGFAYCKMLFEGEQPQDFVYLEVNAKFEELTGLHDVIGKKVTEIIPNIRETNRELLDIYGRVALTGKPERLETYIPGLDMWFSISVYSPQKEHFIAVFDVITERKRTEEALRQSEEKYRSLVDNVRLGIFRSTPGPSGKFLEVSKAMEEITGYSRKELLRMDVSSLYVHPEERESVTEEIASAREKITKELNFRKKDGTEIVVADTKTPVRGGAGEILYFDGVLEDVTEHKQAEEMLRQSEEKLRLMFESITDSIAVTDLNGNIIECNEGPLRMCGYASKQEVVGRNALEFIAPCDHSRARENMERTLADGYVQYAEYTCLTKDGREFLVELSSALLKDSVGDATGFIAVTKDITERKQAEMERQANLSLFHALIENMQAGVLVETDERKIFVVNKTFCQIFSIPGPPEAIVGSDCSKAAEMVKHLLVEPDLFPRRVDEIVKKRKLVIAEEIRFADGHVFERDHIPIFTDGDRFIGHMWQYRDITGRKRIEAERLELERKAQNASRLASIGEMAAGIAHEINNPLTPILGFTEILMKRELPEDAKFDLKIIYDSARRTADVTRRLLTFARQSKPMRVKCDMNEVVESTLQLRVYQLTTSGIKVITEFAPNLPPTMADAGQLQQVVLNLIMNAEYEMTNSHGGGNFQIKTEKTGNIIRISIKDDGPGISRENMERLFTPFFTTKKAGEGTGLGLSVCHGIIAEHNGRIYAQSKLGKGATFIIEMPITR